MTFDYSGPHYALLNAAIKAHATLVPSEAAAAHATTLRAEGRDAEADVLEAYASAPPPPSQDERIAALEAEVEGLVERVKKLRAQKFIRDMKERTAALRAQNAADAERRAALLAAPRPTVEAPTPPAPNPKPRLKSLAAMLDRARN